MSKKKKRGAQQRQKPLDAGLSEDEARALLKSTSTPLELFRALSALGLCVAYGSWDNPTIKLSPAWAGYAPAQEMAEQSN